MDVTPAKANLLFSELISSKVRCDRMAHADFQTQVSVNHYKCLSLGLLTVERVCLYECLTYLQLVEPDQVTVAAKRGQQAALFRPEVRSSSQ